MKSPEALVNIVTTDLGAITRGRPVAESRLDRIAQTGVGWVPANLSISPFGSIADPNPWGSTGDLRLIPDMAARFRTVSNGSASPFDMIAADIVELDGTPWVGCSRQVLKDALAALRTEAALTMKVAVEQEFRIFDAGFGAAHSFSIGAIRRADPFCPILLAALEEAGVEPEMILAEYGTDQFEITHAPTDALKAADRAVAIREIVRDSARAKGWRASFAPKTALNEVGNGVHIHFSFVDESGNPAAYDRAARGGLSTQAAAFCAGVLRHLPAITVLTASSVPSYYRLKPHSWSSSYTWLAERDREASLRICPTVTIGGRDPAPQYNIEFRVADATANPYLAIAALVRAGLEGLRRGLPPPPLATGDPTQMDEGQLKALGLVRLPQSLSAALEAFHADRTVTGWFHPLLVETFDGVKRHEIARLAELEEGAVCDLYGTLF